MARRTWSLGDLPRRHHLRFCQAMSMTLKPGLGLLLVLVSGVALFYAFAWSALSDGEFEEGSESWWRTVLGTMFRPGPNRTWTAGACVGLAFGLFLCAHGLRTILRREMVGSK